MNWRLFLSAFFTLFVAELGDKTQLAVFCMSADKKQPLPIFLGASAALIAVTFIGAFFGEFITRYIPQNIVKLVAGFLFVGIGIYVLWEAIPSFISHTTR